MKKIIIGSRGSDLALWQANFVKDELLKLGQEVEIKVISTQGDRIQHLSFDKMEGKGFFTKEIEESLLNESIDLAVHSHKDLETSSPKGLVIAAVPNRANPADVLIIRRESADPSLKFGLKKNAVVGTSSARRRSQIIALRPDISTKDLRGNVPTRIRKLVDDNYDAILLAKAGIDRLEIDLSEFKVTVMDPTEFVPAPAQGALALQVRASDRTLIEQLEPLNRSDTKKRIDLERKILNLLDGGCQLPLGAYCTTNNELHVSFSGDVDQDRIYKKYEVEDFDALAHKVVSELI